ncbi:MAG TPA: hypothetical protein VEU33_11590 [Archangium sp.]|nr:hypothetical protein [Archangium sp.]
MIWQAREHSVLAAHPGSDSRSSLHVRRGELKRNARLKLTFAAFRFCLYGMVGLSSEIFFYTLVRIARHVPLLEALFRFPARHARGDGGLAPVDAVGQGAARKHQEPAGIRVSVPVRRAPGS